MGCWIVPAVAAELWGVPLGDVLECMRNGTLFWKDEDGFILVDSDRKAAETARNATEKKQNPPTFIPVAADKEPIVSQDELKALTAGTEPDESGGGQYDWQIARRQVGRIRRAPAS